MTDTPPTLTLPRKGGGDQKARHSFPFPSPLMGEAVSVGGCPREREGAPFKCEGVSSSKLVHLEIGSYGS
jgi:hypothetical protein